MFMNIKKIIRYSIPIGIVLFEGILVFYSMIMFIYYLLTPGPPETSLRWLIIMLVMIVILVITIIIFRIIDAIQKTLGKRRLPKVKTVDGKKIDIFQIFVLIGICSTAFWVAFFVFILILSYPAKVSPSLIVFFSIIIYISMSFFFIGGIKMILVAKPKEHIKNDKNILNSQKEEVKKISASTE